MGAKLFGSRKARAPEQPDWTTPGQFAPGMQRQEMQQKAFFDIYD